ncbi:hypothetical protein [Archaeoglobus profundus]|uniref:hypothetical protein n=1 Tax=Archaeoglobus profundus TaxID=84156 RepID=UPI00064E56FD|nr:hypothetical protein [Archaeoglobus profundus]
MKLVGALKIGKKTFEFLIYIIVIHLVVKEIDTSLNIYILEEFSQAVFIILVAVITLIGSGLGAYLIKVHRDLMRLVEAVDVIPAVKTACFSFALFGLYGIHRLTHEVPHVCPLLVFAVLASLVTGFQLLHELNEKYLKLLRRYSHI